MNILNKTFKNLNNIKSYEIIFIVLVILYLISNISIPYNLSPMVNNVYTYFSSIVILILLLINNKYLLSIVFFIFITVLFIRSKKIDYNLIKPSQENKNKKMVNLNSNLDKKSLEEEVINSIIKKPDNIPNPETYHPVLCSSHNADEL